MLYAVWLFIYVRFVVCRMRTIGRCNKRSSNTQKQDEAVAFGALNALCSVVEFGFLCLLTSVWRTIRMHATILCGFVHLFDRMRSCVCFSVGFGKWENNYDALFSLMRWLRFPFFVLFSFRFDFFCFVIIYLNATRKRASCGRLYKLWINK